MEHFGEKGSMHLHGGFRAEFLTAEAADASLSVNYRLFVFDHYRFCGADSGADSAADAHILL